MGKTISRIAILYLVIGIIALVFVPASVFGWFGAPDDPLSGIFAYLLSLPWVLAIDLVGGESTWVTLAFCAGGIGINFLLLRWLGARLTR